MIKLQKPNYTNEKVFELCQLGITGNKKLLKKINSYSCILKDQFNNYCSLASDERLFTIEAKKSLTGDDYIIEDLTNSELIKLYTNYFVQKGKPAREIYEQLMAASNGKCPFCGGIGSARNLDHYLPKNYYPQFSVLPVNLIPSCRDCNMDGKKDSFPLEHSKQLLQPYFDHERYFNQQWLSARYIVGDEDEPGVIEYFVEPPDNWTETQKKRVKNHFVTFDLGLRFSKEAGVRLVILLEQIKNLLNHPNLTLEEAKDCILTPIIKNSLIINHWERVMCVTLMKELEDSTLP